MDNEDKRALSVSPSLTNVCYVTVVRKVSIEKAYKVQEGLGTTFMARNNFESLLLSYLIDAGH